jgi:hypothetical protein
MFAMRRIMVLLFVVCSAIAMVAQAVAVNCNAGQSLNAAISKLNKLGPNTVTVQGTCAEYVTISGFENLTVKSTSGATLVQPSIVPTNIFVSLLRINASRSVTVDGLNFSSDSSKPPAIGIGGGSNDVRLRNLNVTGGSAGIIIFENSQVSIAGVNVTNAGYASISAYDLSDVHLENCVLQDLTGVNWHSGINFSSAHATIRRMTIRNMDVGLAVADGGSIDISDFDTYYPSGGVADVVIENSAGKNSTGVSIDGGSSIYVATAKLRINNAGQAWGDSIDVSNGSTLNASANLIISGSHGQGILVINNSQAVLDGSSITGGLHGGLVAVNMSTIAANTWDLTTSVSGNAVDLFCDSKSLITGTVHIANANTIQCPNLLAGDTPPIP